MPIDEVYRRQVALLVRAIPEIAPETCFALKGGTAINLFVRDMPRVSVDIDLTYVPVEDRRASLIGIHQAMQRIAERLKAGIRNAEVMASVLRGEGCVTKLVVRADDVQIKIEVTPVLRGCVYDPVIRSVTPRVEERFGFAEAQVVSLPDLYAGKIIAALDRQHPRDLFDVRTLLANEGISDDLRKAFVVYLVSSNRPMAELLAPSRLDITQEYGRGFLGMTETPMSLDELVQAREDLVDAVVRSMPGSHRRFLISVKRGLPEWDLLGLPGVDTLPAVRWRLENLAKVNAEKRGRLLARLMEVLDVGE
jgi:hypothetical protein